ncbi:Rv1476 family membrane protein [Rhodococcus sp. NPDC003382]|uniref:Rv1476 family membrane protein n=1 Tax=Rhodococcus sp. HM1 TaxID=2937759 RepID=UPI0034D55BA6
MPSATDLPPSVTLEQVLADLADDGVSAPSDRVDDLVEQVERAQDHGIELRVIVVDRDPRIDSQLRDLATEVGSEQGGTVLVLSPGWVGAYSDSLDRVTLEAAQDRTYTGDPVVSTRNFVDSITEPGPDWTAWTVVLIVLVAAAAGATAAAKAVRRRKDEAAFVEPDAR